MSSSSFFFFCRCRATASLPLRRLSQSLESREEVAERDDRLLELESMDTSLEEQSSSSSPFETSISCGNNSKIP